jgi:hypothetical protein
MAYGLEVRNSSNQVVVTTDTRLAYYVGSYTIPTIPARPAGGAPTSVNITIPGYSTDGTWFIFIRGETLYVGITEFSGYIEATNSNYFAAYTGAAVIEVFRG